MSLIRGWLGDGDDHAALTARHDHAPALVSASDTVSSGDNSAAGRARLMDIFGLGGSAGMPVNEKTAMRISAVYACVNLIAGSASILPFHIYQRVDDARQKAKHDLWWLLNERPNPKYSAATFWQYIHTSKLLHGDGFAKIIRRNKFNPDIQALELIHPQAVDVKTKEGRLVYYIYRKDQSIEAVDQDDMLHFAGLGFDGERSLSPLRSVLLQPAGIALAAGQYSEEFFRNGARADFAIKSKSGGSPEALQLVRDTWGARHQGIGNRHLPAILQGDLEIEQLTINAEDAQLLETRRFQIEDICRAFGVPPHMVGLTDKTTSWGSGIEHMSLGFIKFTLLQHLVPVQQEVNSKCFRTDKYFGEFNTAALERGDIKSRNEAYRIALGRAGEDAWMTENEVRRLENLPPLDGGDILRKGSKDDSDA